MLCVDTDDVRAIMRDEQIYNNEVFKDKIDDFLFKFFYDSPRDVQMMQSKLFCDFGVPKLIEEGLLAKSNGLIISGALMQPSILRAGFKRNENTKYLRDKVDIREFILSKELDAHRAQFFKRLGIQEHLTQEKIQTRFDNSRAYMDDLDVEANEYGIATMFDNELLAKQILQELSFEKPQRQLSELDSTR